MKTLSTLKKDLEFNKGLSSLIEALKTIAVAQYRILEQKLRTFEKLILTIENFFDLVDIKTAVSPFLTAADKPRAVVAITSDSGLLGGLNMQVINGALSELGKNPGTLIVIGERGKAYARDSGVPFVAFPGIKDEERFGQAMQLRDYVHGKVMDGAFGPVSVVYPRPVTFTVQKVENLRFLPFTPAVKKAAPGAHGEEIAFESSLKDIAEYLIFLWMGQKFYELFGLSRLAEFAARFVHLEDSHQRLKEMDSKTRLDYFRVRHEIIDRNMRELFAARLAFG